MKTRNFQTKIWRDEWFARLSMTGKMVFLYVFTNEFIGFTGIYELSDRQILFDTGITQKQLDQAKEEIKNKVSFIDGWVYVKNAEKYDPIKGEHNPLLKTKTREWEKVPPEVLEHINSPKVAPTEGLTGGELAPQGNGKGEGEGVIGVVVKKGFSQIEDISKSEVAKIAESENVPIHFVEGVLIDMRNWRDENPQRNKKSNWYATLWNWVRREKKHIVQTVQRHSKGVDIAAMIQQQKGSGYEVVPSSLDSAN